MSSQPIVTTRVTPDGFKPEEDKDDGLETCMDAMIRAINAKDSKALASAFKDAMDICQSKPESEYKEEG